MRFRREPSTKIMDLKPDQGDMREDVIEGLSRDPKSIPCKYFYDERGARLFEQICDLTEYYPTRTELVVMQDHVQEMAALMGPRVLLVELGSGSSLKTRFLLDTLEKPAAYVPVDICKPALVESHRDLEAAYPEIEILPVCADFTEEFPLPVPTKSESRTVVYFPGSTIGNFTQKTTVELLQQLARMSGPKSGLLIGIDLKKDPGVLHRAYNDARGITSAFNLNLLARINRELDADFQLDCFRHYAFYNPTLGRIEMHLVSLVDQTVHIGGTVFQFFSGESILTELSHKFDQADFADLASKAGYAKRAAWTDPRQQFCVQYLEAVD